MEINCPSCTESVLLVDADIGKKIECPFCGNRFRVDGGNNFEKNLKATEESPNNNYCSNCGNKLNSGVKFCSSCGSYIGEALTASPPVPGAIHSQTDKKQHTLTGGWWGLIFVMNTVFCINKLLKTEVSSFAFIYAVCGLLSLIGAIRAFVFSTKD